MRTLSTYTGSRGGKLSKKAAAIVRLLPISSQTWTYQIQKVCKRRPWDEEKEKIGFLRKKNGRRGIKTWNPTSRTNSHKSS